MPAKQRLRPLSLTKAFDGFFFACQARKLSVHTMADYRNTFRLFLAHVGDVPIASITYETITAFLARQDKVKAKTVLNYHTGLSALWAWAVKDGYVEQNVVRMITPPDPEETVIEPFTELEVRALFNGLRTHVDRDRAVLLLLVDTGLRASELCNLKHSDIDLINRRIKTLGKGGKERSIPFSSRTASAIFKHLANMEGEKPFLFNRDTLRKQLARIGKRAGVNNVHPHRFRHTFAITYLRNRGDPYTLQDILGHSTMEMVRRYLKIANTDLDAAHRHASPVENWKL